MSTDEAYLAWELDATEGTAEMLAAELADIGFEGFEENPHGVTAWVPARVMTDGTMRRFRGVLERFGVTAVGTRQVEPVNWNAAWESTVEPVEVGGFVVHPPWHDAPASHIGICIEPKMSFGTGRHESTRLMLRLLPDLVKAGDRVLDAGTGTGVLAIAAVRLGAAHVTGFDIDSWSVRNARENAASNHVDDRFDVMAGSFDDVPSGPVDVILANINRNVLVDMLPTMRKRLVPGGRVALSGVLVRDRDVLITALGKAGFRCLAERTEGEWWAATAEAV